MSVQFITGKPGGGKSMLATRILVDELRRSKRRIVTNLPIVAEGLAVFCAKEGIDLPGGLVANRVTSISEEQLRWFWRIRGPWDLLEMLPLVGAGTADEHADYSGVQDQGVLYILDEIHIAYNSRAWQKTGAGVMYYLSQHRKLGDDVVLISQAIANVDKQMRSVVQDFTVVRNVAKEMHGVFNMPRMFIRRTFLETPTPSSKAIETRTMRLDVEGLGSCYNTAAGVGIVGQSGADTSERRRGLPWWSAPVALVIVCWLFVGYGPSAVARFFFTGKSQPVAKVAPPAAAPVAAAPPPPPAAPVIWPTTRALEVGTNDVVTGWAGRPGAFQVCWGGGSVTEAARLERIGPGHVLVDGNLWKYKPNSPSGSQTPWSSASPPAFSTIMPRDLGPRLIGRALGPTESSNLP